MIAPDVNVLVAAFLPDHPHHARARRWLSAALASSHEVPLILLPMVAVGFIRVVTSARASSQPIALAIEFVRRLFAVASVSMPQLGHEWIEFEAMCIDKRLQGAIVSDAWIAAAVVTQQLHLVTFDADFRRLLQPHQLTLLVPENRVQEPRLRYLARAA